MNASKHHWLRINGQLVLTTLFSTMFFFVAALVAWFVLTNGGLVMLIGYPEKMLKYFSALYVALLPFGFFVAVADAYRNRAAATEPGTR